MRILFSKFFGVITENHVLTSLTFKLSESSSMNLFQSECAFISDSDFVSADSSLNFILRELLLREEEKFFTVSLVRVLHERVYLSICQHEMLCDPRAAAKAQNAVTVRLY